MEVDPLSLKFQITMGIVAGFFWLVGLIPLVNVVTNVIYWVIMIFVFILKYKPLIGKIVKAGVAIGSIYLKIGMISGIAFVLGEIPIISIIPWDVMANLWINRLTKEMLAKIKQLTKDVGDLKKGWQAHKQSFNEKWGGNKQMFNRGREGPDQENAARQDNYEVA